MRKAEAGVLSCDVTGAWPFELELPRSLGMASLRHSAFPVSSSPRSLIG